MKIKKIGTRGNVIIGDAVIFLILWAVFMAQHLSSTVLVGYIVISLPVVAYCVFKK